MDLRKLKTLIDLVSESNISELEITEAEGNVRIVKAGLVPASAMMMAAPVAPVAGSEAALASNTAAPPLAPEPAAETGHVITSPMVGTFYKAPEPGADAYVKVGSRVTAGQTVCIIEAMKIMNEIEATHTGTVTKVLCENGQPVEFGQPLFVIE